MAAAGIDYFVGRQSNALFGEDFNGFRAINEHNYHYFKSRVDPYKIKGDSKSGLLKFISAQKPSINGVADKKVQAYCFRMCLTDVLQNRIKIAKPENYNPADYELSARYFEAEPKALPVLLHELH